MRGEEPKIGLIGQRSTKKKRENGLGVQPDAGLAGPAVRCCAGKYPADGKKSAIRHMPKKRKEEGEKSREAEEGG